MKLTFFALLIEGLAHATLQHLDTPAYNRQVADSDLSLVLFTATGCAACDQVYQVLDDIQFKVPEMPIGVLNCFEEPKTCDQASISSVPKLMLVVGEDELVQYSEGFDSESLGSFIQRQNGPAVTNITTLDDSKYTSPSSISVVAFIAANDEASQTVYAQIAHKWRRHFSFTLYQDTHEAFEQPGLLVFKPFDEIKTQHRGPFQQSDIEDFLLTTTLPLIQHMDHIVYERHIGNGIPLGQILCLPDECSQLAAMMYPLANHLRDKMAFMIVNSADYLVRGEYLGLGEGSRHGFSIEDVQTTRTYPLLERNLSAETIGSFIQQFLDGELKPTIRSTAPTEVEDQAGPLLTLVGSTFETVAMDKNRDVLALFEAPWCEYCQELHPVLEELGKQYIQHGLGDKVAVVKVDVSSNDVPTRIEEYPTIRLWRAGDNAVQSFNGTYFSLLTTGELAAFLESKGGHTLGLTKPGDHASKDEL